ncbi:MAG: hypothetical protein J6P98_07140, partial [Clostridia bacterium]|nr:hypothetical protein [Clostridia bacterium]
MEAITEKDNIPKLKPKRQPKPLKIFGALALFFSAFLHCAAGLVYYLYAFGGYGTFRLLGAVGLLLIFFAAFGCYLFIIHREVTKSLRKMLFICLLLVIAAALVLVCVNINAGFSPVLIAVLLIALMIGPGVAVFSALPLAVMSGVAVGVLNGPAV